MKNATSVRVRRGKCQREECLYVKHLVLRLMPAQRQMKSGSSSGLKTATADAQVCMQHLTRNPQIDRDQFGASEPSDPRGSCA